MIELTMVGRLGRDSELRYTQANTPVLVFSLAGESGYGARKQTEWFDCSIFGKQGEALEPYLKKGKEVVVVGSFSTHEKGDRTYLKLKVRELKLVGGQRQEAQQSQPKQDSFDDDDIPFN